MRIIFAGTPEFSVPILQAIIQAKHELVGVYCQPDRPKGRGQKLTACAVKTYANTHNLPIYQPDNLKNTDTQSQLLALNADVMVVVAYGQLLPKIILQAPKYGCLNIHASLLPRWRGAAPIQRAILAGDNETGISIMQMNEGLDTGDVLLQKICPITDTDTALTLHNKLSILAADLMIDGLNNIDNLTPSAQSQQNITYAKKLKKNQAWIDWGQTAMQINQQIRAFNPYPIAQTYADTDKFSQQVLRILSANIIEYAHDKNPGEIIKCTQGVCYLATTAGVLSLETVQLSGKKAINIKDFTNAYTLTRVFSD